ncbi:leucine-rich repeat-containing protein 47 [Gadus morhua]|nr:leucine-rich repeat-containing protein 47 [Gadus morhua]
MDDLEDWPEIEKALKEKRRELVLQGASVEERIAAGGGLTKAVYSLKLLNYLEVAQCPSLTEIHEDIKYLTNLQSLFLCRNKLRSIPKVIGSIQSLKVLDVSVNNLTVLPDEITQLPNLNTLNVSCNSLVCLPEGLSKCSKLYHLNISKNNITSFPSDFYSDRLDLLSTVIAYDNAIEELSGDVSKLAAIKNLDLSNNKLCELPFSLSDCAKLKDVNFKGNKFKDKRLEKMVNGCQTKSILDYIRAGGRGKGKGKPAGEDAGGDVAEGGDKKKRPQKKNKKKQGEEEQEEELAKMVVRILHLSDSPTAPAITVTANVKDVRPYLVCCVVKGMNLKPGNALKRFLMAQTKLHDELCVRRTTATIATHDLQLLKSPLVYDARPPADLKITPLGRKEVCSVELMKTLQQEASDQRKQKKRQNVSGLHKYLQLLDGKELYPCLVDAEGHVISFPPITNSDKTKISQTTKELFLEVTSSTSLQTCKDVMDALIVKMAELNKFTAERNEETDAETPGPPGSETPSQTAEQQQQQQEEEEGLLIQQVRTVDQEGNLKVVYPSKTDLPNADETLKIIW